MNRSFFRPIRELRCVVPYIEPTFSPPGQTTRGIIVHVLGFFPLLQLEATPPNSASRLGIGLRLEMEDIMKQIPVRPNTEKCFAEMNKNRNVDNGIGSEVVDLDAIKVLHSMKKFRSGESKTTLHEMLKQNQFINIFIGHRVRSRFTPLTTSFDCSKPSSTSLRKSEFEHLLLLHSTSTDASFDYLFFPRSVLCFPAIL